MTLKYLIAACAGAAALVGAGSALAHHSFSQEFDSTKPMTLAGKVVKFEWVNPHSWIHVDVVNRQTGAHQVWRVEGGAPSALLRRGWNRNSLPAGTSISVSGFASRDGDTRASASEITFPDGRQLSLGNPRATAKRGQSSWGAGGPAVMPWPPGLCDARTGTSEPHRGDNGGSALEARCNWPPGRTHAG